MSTTSATPTIESNTVPFGMNQELHDKAVNLVLKRKADTKVRAASRVRRSPKHRYVWFADPQDKQLLKGKWAPKPNPKEAAKEVVERSRIELQ